MRDQRFYDFESCEPRTKKLVTSNFNFSMFSGKTVKVSELKRSNDRICQVNLCCLI